MREARTSLSLKPVFEKMFSQHEGSPHLVHSQLEIDYEGELAGSGNLEELKITFSSKRSASQGLMRFSGTLGALKGSFVLTHTGKTVSGRTTMLQQVVPGSGTGGFKGIRGKIKADGFSSSKIPAFFRYFFA